MNPPKTIPSGYLIDQAKRDGELSSLSEAIPGIEEASKAKAELLDSVLEDTFTERVEPTLIEDEPAAQGKSHSAAWLVDPTLTDLEKELAGRSERMLLFAWAYAKEVAEGSKTGFKKRAAIAAGCPKDSASVWASRYMESPIVKRVIMERLPGTALVKGMTKDYKRMILGKIIERSMQLTPVMGKDGSPTGFCVYEPAMAIRAIQEDNAMTGDNKALPEAPVVDPDAQTGTPVQMDVNVGGIAGRVGQALIDGLKSK